MGLKLGSSWGDDSAREPNSQQGPKRSHFISKGDYNKREAPEVLEGCVAQGLGLKAPTGPIHRNTELSCSVGMAGWGQQGSAGQPEERSAWEDNEWMTAMACSTCLSQPFVDQVLGSTHQALGTGSACSQEFTSQKTQSRRTT